MRIVDGCGELALATALVQFDRASLGVNRPLGDTPALHSRMQLRVPNLEPNGD